MDLVGVIEKIVRVDLSLINVSLCETYLILFLSFFLMFFLTLDYSTPSFAMKVRYESKTLDIL